MSIISKYLNFISNLLCHKPRQKHSYWRGGTMIDRKRIKHTMIHTGRPLILLTILLLSPLLLFSSCDYFFGSETTYPLEYVGNGSTGGTAPFRQMYPALRAVTVAGRYTLVKTGHEFINWNTQSDGSGDSYAPGDIFVMPPARAFLYAQWQPVTVEPQTVTISFDAQGGTPEPATKTVTVGQPYGTLPAPTKADHNFLGWWTGPDATGTLVTATTTVLLTTDHTLHAKWQAVTVEPQTVTVSFDAQGGTPEPATKTVTVGQPYGTLPAPTKADHDFLGWWTVQDATGTLVTATTTVELTTDHVLYARWEMYVEVEIIAGDAAPTEDL
jgi:uncharacterized repeat protein (TIGR02543 family)